MYSHEMCIRDRFPTGAGVTITPKTPLHFVPEEYGLSSAHLKRIDSIALDGIRPVSYTHLANPVRKVLSLLRLMVLYISCQISIIFLSIK